MTGKSGMLGIAQFALTFIVLLGVYMLAALTTYQSGADGLLGMLIFQPIFGSLLALLTLAVCFLVGLPMRLIGSARQWWQRQFLLTAGGAVAGVLILIVACFLGKNVSTTTPESLTSTEFIPDLTVFGIGWFTLAFFLLHGQPPRRWLTFWRRREN